MTSDSRSQLSVQHLSLVECNGEPVTVVEVDPKTQTLQNLLGFTLKKMKCIFLDETVLRGGNTA